MPPMDRTLGGSNPIYDSTPSPFEVILLFEVFAAVTMNTVFLNDPPCSLEEKYQHFGGTWCLLFKVDEQGTPKRY